MGKQITVDLVFNANTEQAQQQMRALKASMETLGSTVNMDAIGNGFTAKVSKAQDAVISLKTNLQSAFNVDTGRLNLGKFNENLKRSGMTLKEYRTVLGSLGPEGYKAFQQLTTAIVQGEVPLKRTKNLLTTMMDTFGSSIKWSIAYGAIHKFTEGMREAFSYAQELNNSLTNIRTITGQSADEMAKFAKSANQAAQNLATTTTDYTKAALIYYRQGLTGEEVEKRTETTLKLANVTGKSAEEVSEWMTSVWNNFDNGSKSLEYYADVLSKLGVTTASSAEEIATGMQKFSAVANTVGLSYEYAASALATITAKTRQSADSVGTALKTLFSRMEQLKQGDTLEDGTTLGQYSEALAKVGVEIKDASGNLNSMNSIIDQAGERWKTLAQDQKVALAQSVAGIRQYTQFIALMDNYDTFKENVLTAEGSEGALQKQQDIWAESWEAANKRVKAATEGLYDNLINDKFFINLENMFADLVSAVTDFVEAIGGLRTLLPLVAGWMMKAFGPTALSMIKGFTSNLMGPSQAQQNAVLGLRKEAISQASQAASDTDTQAGYTTVNNLKQEENMLKEIEGINRHLSEGDIERVQLIVQTNREYQKSALALAEELDKINQINDALQLQAKQAGINVENQERSLIEQANGKRGESALRKGMDNTKALIGESIDTQSSLNKFVDSNPENARQNLSNLSEMINTNQYQDYIKEALGSDNFELLQKNIDQLDDKAIQNLQKSLKGLNLETTANKEATKMMTESINKNCKGVENVSEVSEGYVKNLRKMKPQLQDTQKIEESLSAAEKKVADNAKQATAELQAMAKVPLGERMISLAGTIGTTAAGLSMLYSGAENVVNMFKTGEHSLSGWLGALTSLGFAIPMVVNGLKAMQLSGPIEWITAWIAATKAKTAAITFDTLAMRLHTKNLTKDFIQEQATLALQELSNGAKEKDVMLTMVQNIKLQTGIGSKKAYAIATEILTAAQQKENTEKKKSIALDAIKYWYVTLIIAAIAALAAITVVLIKNQKTANEQLAEDQKNLEKAQETLEKVTTAYENLKKSIEDYTNAKNGLNSLVRGTQEWNEAMIKLNQQVLSLLKIYPKLADYIVSNNGVLEISQNGFDLILKEQQKAIQNATTTVELANKQVKISEQRIKNEEFINEKTEFIHPELTFEEKQGSKAVSQAIVKANGQTINIGDQIVGRKTQGVDPTESVALQKSQEGISKINQVLLEGYAKYGENLLNKSSNLSDDEKKQMFNELAEKLNKYSDGLGEHLQDFLADSNWTNYIRELAKNNELIDQQNRMIAQNILQNNALYQNSDYKEALEIQFANAKKEMTETGKVLGEKIKIQIGDKEKGIGSFEKFATQFINGYNSNTESKGDLIYASDLARALGLTYDENTLGNRNDDTDKAEQAIAKEIVKKITGETNDNLIQVAYTGGDQFQYKITGGENKTDDWVDDIYYEDWIDDLYEDYQNKVIENALPQFQAAAEQTAQALKNLGVENQEAISKAVASVAQSGTADLTEFSRSEVSKLKNELQEQGYMTENGEKTNKAIAGSTEAAIIEGLNNYEEALAEKIKTVNSQYIENYAQNWQQDLQTALKAAEMTSEDFDDYVETLQASNEALALDKDLARDVAKQNIKLSVAMNSVSKTLSDMATAAEDFGNKAEYLKSPSGIVNIKKIQSALKDWLGVQLDLEDSAENGTKGLKSLYADGTLEKAINNDTEAIAELQKQAAKQIVLDMDLDLMDPKIKEINDWLLKLADTAFDTNITVGADLDLTEYQAKLNDMLAAGDISVEQLEKTFSAMGYDLNVRYTEADATNVTYTQTLRNKAYGSVDPEKDAKDGGWEATIVKSKTKIPQIVGADYRGKPSITSLPSTSKSKSSSGGSSSKPKNWDAEKDRYHEIEKVISDQTKQYDALSKAKERVYGAKVLSLMDQEIVKQKEIIESNKRLLEEAKAYYEYDRNKLLSNFAVTLDESGRITNYEELQDQFIAAQDEDRLSAFKEMASQYENTLDKVHDQVEKINDEMDKLYELNLEKITTTVQIKVELADDDKVYIDFLLSKVDDDAFKAAEAIQLLGESAAVTVEKIDATTQGIEDLQGALARGEITEAQAIDKLREYRDTLVTLNSELTELRQNVQDKLSEAFDAWTEKLSKNREKIERYGKVIDDYQNIIDLVGKDNLGIGNDILKQLRDTRLANSKDALKAAKAEQEAIDATLEKYRAARDEAAAAGDTKSVEERDKQIEVLEDKSNEAADTVQDLWSSTLEVVKDNFQATVEEIADNFSKAISGMYDNLEDLRRSWDRQQEVAERYLKTYEQTYEINKLNRQIQQDIDKSDSIKNQQELHALQQEMLNMTKDGQKLSKNDLEYLQKKYDLMVAEQAFRDAQNAKSMVRLQRDSQGNFNYVYTADSAATDQAQQNYEDKLYAYQEFSNKMDQNLTEEAIKLNEWAYEQIEKAAELYGIGTEKYEQEVERILAQYDEDMWYITDEYEKLTGRNLEINQQFSAGVAETYNDTYLGHIYPDYGTFQGLYDTTTEEIGKSIEALKGAEKQYQIDNAKVFKDAGLNYEGFKNKVKTELGEIQTKSSETAQASQKMAGDMNVAMDEIIGKTREFQDDYSKKMQAIQDSIQNTIDKVNGLINSYASLATQANTTATALNNLHAAQGTAGYTGSGGGGGSTGSGNVPGSWQKTLHSVGQSTKDGQLYSSISAIPTTVVDGTSYYTDGTYLYPKNTTIKQYRVYNDATRKKETYYYIPQGSAQYQYYDSGGYTGSWGPEGRLAMLHQKELVLNKEDTANFLAAVDIVRGISDQIDRNAMVIKASNELSNYRSTVQNNGNTIKQEVTIHADFPNATNHVEIEEAFRNLTNLASQYANRKF